MKYDRSLIYNERVALLLGQILGVVLFGLVGFPALVFATPGDLDTTFGSGGKVLMPIDQSPTRVQIQSDGKIVTLTDNYWDDGYSVFSRLNADGSLDTGFGDAGYIFTANYGIIFDFIIQPDSKILGVGESFSGGGERFSLFRFNVDGSPDTGFGANGIVTPPFNYGPRTAGWGVVLQQDGKIVAKGNADTHQGARFLIVRHHPGGTLDTTFGTNGIVDEPAVGIAEEKILVQPDNKLIVSGWRFIARYNSNGTLDNGFGTNGKVSVDVDNLQLQEDGKVVVITWGNQLKRYNSDGAIDSSFGLNGLVSITEVEPGTPYGASRAFAIHKNGKMSVAGSLNGTFAVSRYYPDGHLDTNFGTNGVVITPLGNSSSSSRISALTFQPDGKIVAAGNYWPNSPGFYPGNLTLVRYLGDGTSERIVAGRVLTPNGLGIRNATVYLTDSQGFRRQALTSSLGYYTFAQVRSGETYAIGVSSRRYRFEGRNLHVLENMAQVDFVGFE